MCQIAFIGGTSGDFRNDLQLHRSVCCRAFDLCCFERTRTDCEGNVTAAGLPKSDVLYFELVDDAWVCIRPSGTEPKIKLYVNTNASNPEDSAKENAELVEACKALMA